MTPERWQQVKEIFHSALQHEPGRRSVFVTDACSGDESLRKEVESLIASHEKEGDFIDSPAYEVAGGLLTGEQSELKARQTLGSYEIIAFISRGGMGEVYLAQDTRLGRKVALKFLPASLAGDLDRLRRFEREARAASALNHPNILTIYEISSAEGRQFIATEYVEGETLRQRMVHSRLSVAETLEVAIQVASALAASHQAGIAHRDIKPENIMLRHDGYVKVVDFGLAKLTETANIAVDTSKPTASQINTDTGMVMGTTAYMSPEQARGLTVDARTDIWSLGVVLYEMLRGQAPFGGETPSDIVVSILEREPPSLANFSPQIPETFEWIVTKALIKEREGRYQTATELLTDLRRLKQRVDLAAHGARSSEFVSQEPGVSTSSLPLHRSTTEAGSITREISSAGTPFLRATTEWGKRNRVSAVVASIAVVAALIGIALTLQKFGRQKTRPGQVTGETASVLKTAQVTFSTALDQFPSLSPDGNSIAYCSDQNGSFEIYVKQLTPGGRDIQLTTDGQQNLEPAWSPDAQRIAYFSKNRGGIWIVPAMGGTPKQLVEFGSRPAWSRDGSMIAFQSSAPLELGGRGRNAMPPSTIWIVPSQGGPAKQITQAGNPSGGHGAPSWSPDGKRIVFDASDFASNSLWSVSLGGRDLKKIATDGYDGIYSPDGASIYYSQRGLWQVHVSPTTGEPMGGPFQLASGGPTAISHSTISAGGKKIAYSLLTISSNLWSISLSPGSSVVTGPEPFTRDTSTRNNLPRFSPDGRRIAFNRWRAGTRSDVWIAEADGKNLTQLTSNPTIDSMPSWFPEGDRIAFLSDRNSNHLAMWSITLATGREEPLLDLGEGVEYAVLSPDGKQIAFNSTKSGTINVWTASLRGGEQKQLTFDNELMGFPCWSPDGQFLAFKTNRADDAHIFVIPSSGGNPIQLTFDHGQSWPHSWSPDGSKIAFAGLRNGIWNIYSFSRTTKEQKQLTHYSKTNAFVRYPAWSPLGNQIVYEYAETTGNIWLMELK